MMFASATIVTVPVETLDLFPDTTTVAFALTVGSPIVTLTLLPVTLTFALPTISVSPRAKFNC